MDTSSASFGMSALSSTLAAVAASYFTEGPRWTATVSPGPTRREQELTLTRDGRGDT